MGSRQGASSRWFGYSCLLFKTTHHLLFALKFSFQNSSPHCCFTSKGYWLRWALLLISKAWNQRLVPRSHFLTPASSQWLQRALPCYNFLFCAIVSVHVFGMDTKQPPRMFCKHTRMYASKLNTILQNGNMLKCLTIFFGASWNEK